MDWGRDRLRNESLEVVARVRQQFSRGLHVTRFTTGTDRFMFFVAGIDIYLEAGRTVEHVEAVWSMLQPKRARILCHRCEFEDVPAVFLAMEHRSIRPRSVAAHKERRERAVARRQMLRRNRSQPGSGTRTHLSAYNGFHTLVSCIHRAALNTTKAKHG